MKDLKTENLAYFCFFLVFLVLLHQYVNWGSWFDLSDVHHETFAVALASLGIGILIGKRKQRRK
jgi:hypothetical protein